MGYAKSIIFSEMFGPPLLRLKSFPVILPIARFSQECPMEPPNNKLTSFHQENQTTKPLFLGGIRHHLNFQGLVHQKHVDDQNFQTSVPGFLHEST